MVNVFSIFVHLTQLFYIKIATDNSSLNIRNGKFEFLVYNSSWNTRK